MMRYKAGPLPQTISNTYAEGSVDNRTVRPWFHSLDGEQMCLVVVVDGDRAVRRERGELPQSKLKAAEQIDQRLEVRENPGQGGTQASLQPTYAALGCGISVNRQLWG